MAQLPGYDPQDFAAMEWAADILSSLNVEHANIQAVLDVARSNLAALQRDDLKLASGSVHRDAIGADTLALFAASWNPRGAWAAAAEYAKRDTVTFDGDTWLCVEDHVAGTFSTDEGNGLWMAVTQTDANDELLAVSTSGTTSAYTVSSGKSFAAWTNVPPLLVDWHATSADNATIAVDGLAAKNLTVEGSNVDAGELSGKDVVVYDSASDAAVVVGRDRSSTVVKPAAGTSVTGDKSLTDAELVGVGHLVQPIDISGGSGSTVTFTLPPGSAANKGKLVTVRVSAAGADDNVARVDDSGGSKVWQGVRERDYATFFSDGSAWNLLEHKERPIYASADLTIHLNPVAADISSGTVSITLPAPAQLVGEVAEVSVAKDNGAADTGVCLKALKSDGATEYWRGARVSDFLRVTSDDGVNYRVVGHDETIVLNLYVNADQSIAQGASNKITNLAIDEQYGLSWDAGNSQLPIPLDAYLSFSWHPVGTHNDKLGAEAALGGGYLRNLADMTDPAQGINTQGDLVMFDRRAAASDTFQLWATALDDNIGAAVVRGDATKRESVASIRLRWRY